MSKPRTVKVIVNGKSYEREVEPRLLLADFLRHTLGLTGTHVGCEHGVCGACTVLVDGDSARSCLMFAVQADGCRIETVEGLGTMTRLNPLQEAFREHHALQCGFCTPGMLMTATDLLRKYPLATDERDSRRALGQSLSMHRLRAHRPRDPRGGGTRPMKMHILSRWSGAYQEEHLSSRGRSQRDHRAAGALRVAAPPARERAVRYRVPSVGGGECRGALGRHRQADGADHAAGRQRHRRPSPASA